jgi:hypothetical protein
MKISILKTRTRKFTFVSWAIRTFQGTNYSHYAIMVNGSIIDASRKHVRIQSVSDFTKHHVIVEASDIEIFKSFDSEIYPWMVSVSNIGYGFFQIAGLLLVQLGWTRKNIFRSGKKAIICNELVLMLLQRFFAFHPTKSLDDYDLVQTDLVVREYI